jgi:hypothetical protein
MAIHGPAVNEDWVRQSYFLELCQLAELRAADTLFTTLVRHTTLACNMLESELGQRLIGFGADGASIMQGEGSAGSLQAGS